MIKQHWGQTSTIDCFDCDPDKIRSKDAIETYAIELCKLLQVKRFGEPTVVHFGEDEKVAGYSMVQLIETSLVSGHFVNLTNAAYIDIFSCKDYSLDLAKEFTCEFFSCKSCKISLQYR